MTATRETIARPASPGYPAVSPGPRAAGISAGVWAAIVLAALAGVALTFLARDALKGSDLIFNLAALAAAVAYATLGALIVRRAGNPIGWLILAESAGQVLLTLANTYCLLGITTFPRDLPAAQQAGTLAESGFAIVVFILVFMFLLFPTGSTTGGPAERYDPPQFAETEARTVARPGDVCLVGADATKERIVPEINRHGILHFATHAHVATGAAQLSAVLLADGQVLNVADMLGTGIAADLVVLSACDTGTGSLTDGDEVVGLTRGLFAAGAHQAVVSLWPVNDLSTCLLMRRFYQKLANVTVAEALRQTRGELARMDQDQQVDELLALQDELAGHEAPQPVLEAVGQAAATRRGDDPGAELVDFRHPHFWAPFIYLGIP